MTRMRIQKTIMTAIITTKKNPTLPVLTRRRMTSTNILPVKTRRNVVITIITKTDNNADRLDNSNNDSNNDLATTLPIKSIIA